MGVLRDGDLTEVWEVICRVHFSWNGSDDFYVVITFRGAELRCLIGNRNLVSCVWIGC